MGACFCWADELLCFVWLVREGVVLDVPCFVGGWHGCWVGLLEQGIGLVDRWDLSSSYGDLDGLDCMCRIGCGGVDRLIY